MTSPQTTPASVLVDCKAAGIRLSAAENGQLSIDAPQGTLTPTILACLKAHKDELVGLLRPDITTPWEDCVEPVPCDCCGSLMAWWNLLGERQCMVCRPLTKSNAVARRAARLRGAMPRT